MNEQALDVESIVTAIQRLETQDKRKVLEAMVELDDLWEDLRDMTLVLLRQGEPARPYAEFANAQDLDPQGDPLLGFIGMADINPSAQQIDAELYGEAM